MPLHSEQPPLRGEWIKEWIAEDRLRVKPVFHTIIYIVRQTVEIKKDGWRYGFAEGDILLPRQINDIVIYQQFDSLFKAIKAEGMIGVAIGDVGALIVLADHLDTIFESLISELLAILHSQAMQDFLDGKGVLQVLDTLRRRLAKVYSNVGWAIVRPMDKPLKGAQGHLQLALGAIDLEMPGGAYHQIKTAAKQIQLAREVLNAGMKNNQK